MMASGLLSAKTIADLEKPGARNLIRGELISGFNSILGNAAVQEITSPTSPSSNRITEMGDPSRKRKPDEHPGNPAEPLAAEASAREPAATVNHRIVAARQRSETKTFVLATFASPRRLARRSCASSVLVDAGVCPIPSAQLSLYLRLEASIQITKLEYRGYLACIDGLPNPTHLTVFKVEPLNGVCLLDIPPWLGLTICGLAARVW